MILTTPAPDMARTFQDTLTPRQRRFAERYAESLNAAKAAIDAGYGQKSANRQGCRLLMNVDVQRAVRAHHQRLTDAAMVSPVNILRELTDIAFADPAELETLTRESCRHCHGLGHAYQWTHASEFSEALVAFNRKVAAIPADQRDPAQEAAPEAVGGFGFDPRREPHPGCPRCRGEGVEVLWRADIARLSGQSRKLFAGLKETKDGVNIIMRDQEKALEMLGKYFGLFADKLKLENDTANPIALLIAQVQGSAIKPVLYPKADD